MTGQIISHYKIVAKVGEDATGILYKALDGDRPVALKVFYAAPRMEPGLDHPNIARIHEISQSDDVDFAVMDPPEGESLYDFLERERPHRRHLFAVAGQIASALSAAHAAGIVHGPLNPAGIVIRARNDIKLYTVGFAPLGSPPASEEGCQSLFGASVPYVSPEQVTGAAPDIRSDIFSFGALLYHMATGRRAFRGATIADTWKAIVDEEPTPVTELTSRMPPGMDKLIERCLRKNPKRRFARIGQIEPLLEKMSEAFSQNPAHHASFLAKNAGRIARIGAIGLAATAVVVATVYWWQRRPAEEQVIGRQLRQVTASSGYDTDPAVSASGAQVAYASDRGSGGDLDIWTQSIAGGEPRRLTDDPADDREPVFSPDGATIAFRSDRNGGGIYFVPTAGGPARLIAPEGRRPRYSPDGAWIAYWVGPPGLSPKADGAYKVFIVPSTGGVPRQIRPDFASATYPVWSPDGRSLLFLGRPDSTRTDSSPLDWWLADIDGAKLQNTGACQLFHQLGALPENRYGIPGDWKSNHIYFSIAASEISNIWRAEIAGGTVSTKPVKVTSGPDMDTQPSIAFDGRAIFGRQRFNADIWGIPVAVNEGNVTGALKRWTKDPAVEAAPSASADGSKLLFQSNRSGHLGVWIHDTVSGKESPLATVGQEQMWPLVSPDGAKVAFSEARIRGYEHFYRPTAGGSAQLLCDDCGAAISGWSRDSGSVLVDSFSRGVRPRATVSLIKLSDSKRITVLEEPDYDLHQASLSPDDRAIVFVAGSDSGSSRLYITAFHERPPFPAKDWIALTDGTAWETNPHWSPDGRIVYYTSTRDGNRCVWAQRLDAANKPSGRAQAIYHFHSARRAPAQLAFGNTDLFVGRDQILVSLGELTGNIWSVKVSD